ncbi:hypothetical protein K9M41_00295 [Candidatus Gracilibacteria bacterium]|nr:hypothetical protein [Candidatus Gracilibacteria bacterium]
MSFWQKIFGSKQKTTSCSCSPCQCDPCECEDIATLLSLTPEDKEVLKTLDERIIVGKVLEVSTHPDAGITKVRVTKTDLGNGKTEQILCGGVNLEQGQVVAVATIGAKLSPDFEIGIRAIGGVESHGMICARNELGLSPAGEQKGEIWPLPKEAEKYLGKSLRSL